MAAPGAGTACGGVAIFDAAWIVGAERLAGGGAASEGGVTEPADPPTVAWRGAGRRGAGRWVSPMVVAAGSADSVCVGALAAGGAVAGCWSLGRVAVPGRLKFCNSRGPTVSGAGVLVAGGGSVTFWASAGAARSPAVNNIVFKRKIALIAPLYRVIRRSVAATAQSGHARRSPGIQARAG